MSELSEMYNDISPTKQRQKEEKFRPARTSKFWLWVGNQFFYGMLEKRFCAFRYKGAENFFNRDDKYPTIIYAPHTNWWDGIVGYNVCRRICYKEIRIMIEELNRFPLIRRGGGYSVNKKSPQSAMESLRYSVRVLKDPKSVLYIFPQGIINPPNHRPIEFQSGLSYIAQKGVKEYGKINILPLAVNYYFLRDNRPEVWVEFGENIELTDSNFDRKEYSEFLAKKLEELCDKQNLDVSNAQFDGYETLFKQKLVWYRQFEQHLKKLKRRNNK